MKEDGDVFILELGQPVKIINLARRMLVLSGPRVNEPGKTEGDIEIAICGHTTR